MIGSRSSLSVRASNFEAQRPTMSSSPSTAPTMDDKDDASKTPSIASSPLASDNNAEELFPELRGSSSGPDESMLADDEATKRKTPQHRALPTRPKHPYTDVRSLWHDGALWHAARYALDGDCSAGADLIAEYSKMLIKAQVDTCRAFWRLSLDILLNLERRPALSEELDDLLREFGEALLGDRDELMIDRCLLALHAADSARAVRILKEARGRTLEELTAPRDESDSGALEISRLRLMRHAMLALAICADIRRRLQRHRPESSSKRSRHNRRRDLLLASGTAPTTSDGQHGSSAEEIDASVDEALLIFDACRKFDPSFQLVTWDVFVVAIAELHCFRNSLDDAEALLREYVLHQAANPNSHRYLYHFLKERRYRAPGCATDDEMRLLLNAISTRMPSTSYALDLFDCELRLSLATVDRKETSTFAESALSVLFDYVDYAFNRNCLRAWLLLFDFVRNFQLVGTPSCGRQLAALMRSRAAYWSVYHWPKNVSESGMQLFFAKLIVMTACYTPQSEVGQRIVKALGDAADADKASFYAESINPSLPGVLSVEDAIAVASAFATQMAQYAPAFGAAHPPTVRQDASGESDDAATSRSSRYSESLERDSSHVSVESDT